MNEPEPRRTDDSDDSDDSGSSGSSGSSGDVSEVASMDPDEADTPIADGDAVAGYPESESGTAQEPEPEAGPNANPHRDEDTR